MRQVTHERDAEEVNGPLASAERGNAFDRSCRRLNKRAVSSTRLHGGSTFNVALLSVVLMVR